MGFFLSNPEGMLMKLSYDKEMLGHILVLSEAMEANLS